MDGFFRFLCWTVALLPVPSRFASGELEPQLAALSRRLHAARGVDGEAAARIDELAAASYGLSAAQSAALADWLEFLEGRSSDVRSDGCW